MAKKSLLIITTLLIALAAGGGGMYFYNQRQTQLRRTLVPNIATDRLPVARLNQPYSQPVQAVLVGAKTKPMIESANLPDTFQLTDCATTYNQLDLPTPNSVTTCNLTGNPTTAGNHQIQFTATAPQFVKKTTYAIHLIISN